MRLMVQSLLADRFQLKVHFESREVPVLELKVAKVGNIGPKLFPMTMVRLVTNPSPRLAQTLPVSPFFPYCLSA